MFRVSPRYRNVSMVRTTRIASHALYLHIQRQVLIVGRVHDKKAHVIILDKRRQIVFKNLQINRILVKSRERLAREHSPPPTQLALDDRAGTAPGNRAGKCRSCPRGRRREVRAGHA